MQYIFQVDIQTSFLATNGTAVMIHVVGSFAGIELLGEKGARRALPWISLLASLSILTFVGPLIYVTVIVGMLGYLYGIVVGLGHSNAILGA